MGLFLALSGVIGASEEVVVSSLRNYAAQKNGTFCAEQGEAKYPDVLVISSNQDRVSILYPEKFYEWDDTSRYLSETLSCPVFSLHIHDGDMWMYLLFKDGKQIDQFNPIPAYWEEMPEEEQKTWAGNADVIESCVPNLKKEMICNYLKLWDYEDQSLTKAYPNDEYTYNECWQLCDFMKCLGLIFPEPTDSGIAKQAYRFTITKKRPNYKLSTDNIPPNKIPQKPWWKFW
ncbi:MAG: hypothetical protein ABFD91_00445 [Anaerohalosphaeraceae bacterium]